MLFVSVSVLGFCSGCIRSTVYVESDPSGALVFFDGKPQGQTPVEFDFKWHGGHKLKLRKEGFAELNSIEALNAPVHLKFPLDLIATILPFPIKDRHPFFYTLESTEPLSAVTPSEEASEL